MKLVMTGKGKSGSWLIRGLQLGAAIGAFIDPQCSNFKHYDAAIHVKRIQRGFLSNIRKARKPWIWDIVDAYPQPISNTWSQDQAISWLQAEVKHNQPSAMVFPTSRMKEDSGFEGPSLVLPHHAWPKYQRQQIREKVLMLGYEGGEHYLGKWGPKFSTSCTLRGWRFVINGNLSECDIGIAMRDPLGYAAKHWKSNVKIANLQALGLPIICSDEDSYTEFGSGHEITIKDVDKLDGVLDSLQPYAERAHIGLQSYLTTPTLPNVAKEYKAWLNQLKF